MIILRQPLLNSAGIASLSLSLSLQAALIVMERLNGVNKK
jgi:hypothetical protein